MTAPEPRERGEVEALGTFLAGFLDGAVDEVAAEILASPWLAAHVAKVREEAVREERERITQIPPTEPTGWDAEQWRANATYWWGQAQEAYRHRDAALTDRLAPPQPAPRIRRSGCSRGLDA